MGKYLPPTLLLIVIAADVHASNEIDHLDFGCKNAHFKILKRNVDVQKDASNVAELSIYCNLELPRRVSAIFTTTEIRISGDTFEVYHAPNASEVCRLAAEKGSRSWLWRHFLPSIPAIWPATPTSFGDLSGKSGDGLTRMAIQVPTFNSSCVGLMSSHQHAVMLRVKVIDLWRVLLFSAGVAIFLSAARFSRNALFYYSSGVAVGVLGSLLIIVFLLSRLVPKKLGAYGVLIGGWSVVAYLVQHLLVHAEELLRRHYTAAIVYLVVVAMISFAVLYYYGPVDNPRALDLVKWSLQLSGLLCMYGAAQLEEVSLAAIFVLLVGSRCPSIVTSYVLEKCRWCVSPWKSRSPQRRLLTQEEYELEGQAATRRALDTLRSHCNSPDCNSWRLMTSLNSPSRFAKFVQGEPHVTDAESTAYDLLDDDLKELTDDDEADNGADTTTPPPAPPAATSTSNPSPTAAVACSSHNHLTCSSP